MIRTFEKHVDSFEVALASYEFPDHVDTSKDFFFPFKIANKSRVDHGGYKTRLLGQRLQRQRAHLARRKLHLPEMTLESGRAPGWVWTIVKFVLSPKVVVPTNASPP